MGSVCDIKGKVGVGARAQNVKLTGGNMTAAGIC